MKKNKWVIFLIICSVIALLLVGASFYFKFFKNNAGAPQIKTPDVKKYFEENAEVISVTPVKKAKNTLSEKSLYEELKRRGFDKFPVTTNYSMDGAFKSKQEISSASEDKHPIYETYYRTSRNMLWSITIIDGNITAYPSSYNIEHSDKVPCIVSETEEIVSYDSSTNSFYTTKPKKSVLNVRVVGRIDARTLETIDLEG